jgi:hypothetical protein
MINTKKEFCGRVVNIPVSYSEGPEFKSRPGDRLSWQIIRSFPESLHTKSGIVPTNWSTTASFHLLSNSSFTYYHFISGYIA